MISGDFLLFVIVDDDFRKNDLKELLLERLNPKGLSLNLFFNDGYIDGDFIAMDGLGELISKYK